MTQVEIVRTAELAAEAWPSSYELPLLLFGEFVRLQAEQTEYLKSIADSLYADGMAKHGQ